MCRRLRVTRCLPADSFTHRNKRMLDKQTFQQLTEGAEADLVNGYLYGALTMLSNIHDSLQLPALAEEVNGMKADYDRLLHYMEEGTEDHSREEQYRQLIERAYRTLQDTRRAYRLSSQRDVYTTAASLYDGVWQVALKGNMERLSVKSNAEAEDELFEIIWTSPQINATQEEELRRFLAETENTLLRSYLLSALTLAQLHYFDAAKTRLLLEYCLTDVDNDRARAVVGMAIVCHLHGNVLSLFPQLRADLLKLTESKRFIEELVLVQHQFMLYQVSKRLQAKLEHDILPTLIKATQQRAKLGFDEAEIDLNDPDSGLNLSKSARKKIADSMKEMVKMSEEGMDVNLHTFMGLKGFPFFKRPPHWLLPFDATRPGVEQVPFINALRLCDSDKYSLSFLAANIPAEQREQMQNMFENRTEGMEAHGDLHVYQNTIQCLYRCLKCSPWHSLWPDVFSAQMQLIHNPVFGDALRKSSAYLHPIGVAYLRHGQFEQAERHLRLYSELTGSTCELLCQLGFCEQQLKQYQKAINHFLQAQLLEEENPRILFHLQFCYAQLGQHDKQLQYLLQMEKLTPDDVRVSTETGLCLMQLERWSEAQKRFYQMEFKGQRVLPSLRAIAWCALRMKDYNTSKRYYTRILVEETVSAKWEDYLNAAHVEWLQGNVVEAVRLYREYGHRFVIANPEAKDALMPFNQDAPILQEHGKSINEISLMHDLIARDL